MRQGMRSAKADALPNTPLERIGFAGRSAPRR